MTCVHKNTEVATTSIETLLLCIFIATFLSVHRSSSHKGSDSRGNPESCRVSSVIDCYWACRVLLIAIERCRVLSSIVECYQLLSSVDECYQLLSSIVECCRVLKSVLSDIECCQVLSSKETVLTLIMLGNYMISYKSCEAYLPHKPSKNCHLQNIYTTNRRHYSLPKWVVYRMPLSIEMWRNTSQVMLLNIWENYYADTLCWC